MDTGINVDGEEQKNDIWSEGLNFLWKRCKDDYWVRENLSLGFKEDVTMWNLHWGEWERAQTRMFNWIAGKYQWPAMLETVNLYKHWTVLLIFYLMSNFRN